MCGIAGVYEYEGRASVERDILERMLSALYHRGPDDAGIFLDSRLAMGMRRLSIIDLSGGKQPMSNEDGTVTVVFNGEIYNYRQLQQSLLAKGHTLRTTSDTEVIVHLYEDLGEECVQALRGMFAFAIWDSAHQRLFIARDRLGIKPLYYNSTNGRLVFGSEIKAILQHPKIQPQLNKDALGDFLSLKYVPAPSTMFSGTSALPPGHTLTCDRNGTRIERYWQLSFADGEVNHSSEDVLAEQLEALLRESVQLHVNSDVPFGAFLSGGVDSSTIVALMQQITNSPAKTFCVGFEGSGSEAYSELPYARLVAKRLGTDHREVYVGPSDLINLAEKVIWHLDQPIADNACIANYMVSELASRHVKMVLTGEGGDELFAGYARYAGEQLASWFHLVPARMRSTALRVLHRMPGLRRPKIALFALCQTDELTRLSNWFPLFNRNMKSTLLSNEFMAELADPYAESSFRRQLADTDATHWLNRMLYIDTNLWLPDDLLARGDKTSMAASIEARVPLLDHKLVEFAASLSPHMKLRGLTRKYILKRVARQWLPAEVVDRKKQGFPMPFSIWFRREARTFMRDLLSPATLKRRGLFDSTYVETLMEQHQSGVADHGALIWGLLSVELWHRVFLDSPSSVTTNGRLAARSVEATCG